MDLRLKKYVESLEEYTLIEENEPQIPINVRVNNPVLGRTTIIAVSHVEPVDQVLPLNVLWACFDKSSIMYKRLFKRVSRDSDPIFGTQHTWVALQQFEDLWNYLQYYAEGEEPDYTKLPIATVSQLGIVTISQPMEADAEENPVAVSATDPRNTDPRYPILHDEMHEEKPLRQVRTTNSIVTVENVQAGDTGMPIHATSSTASNYKRITESEIHQNKPSYVSSLSSPLPASVSRIQLHLTPLSIDERVSGVSVGKQLTVVVEAYNQSQPGDWIFRLFSGYYRPSAVRLNGLALAGDSITLTEPGTYHIEADILRAGQTLTVHGTVICV